MTTTSAGARAVRRTMTITSVACGLAAALPAAARGRWSSTSPEADRPHVLPARDRVTA